MDRMKVENRRVVPDIGLISLGALLIAAIIFFLMEWRRWLPLFEPGTYEALAHADGAYFHPMWAYVLLWESYGNIVLAVVGAVLFFLLLAKSHRVPKLLSSYFVLGFLFILSSNLILRSFPPTAPMDHSKDTNALVIAALISPLAVLFLLRSNWARVTFTNTSIRSTPRSIALLIVLLLLGYALIGQTAYVVIYGLPTVDPRLADIGISPFFMGVFATLVWYSFFFAALWVWMSKRAKHGFGVGVAVGIAVFFVSLAIPKTATEAIADEEPRQSSSWKREELTEDYMRSLTKNQCMDKTIMYMQECSTPNCLRNAAGISGDCITDAQGSVAEFCAGFGQQYYEPYCSAEDPNQAVCQWMAVTYSVICVEE